MVRHTDVFTLVFVLLALSSQLTSLFALGAGIWLTRQRRHLMQSPGYKR
jgi:hypothetical protein